MTLQRNQYIFIDSCSCRTLTHHKYRGQSMSTWLSCYTTSVLLRNRAIWFTKDEVCSITRLQQQQLTQDPLSAGEVRCCKLSAAQAKAGDSCSWRHSFTSGKYFLYKRLFWNNYTDTIGTMHVIPKKEVHKVACEEWHRSRNTQTKQIGKAAEKWHSQNRMKLRTWNKHLVLKQKELETKNPVKIKWKWN